MNIEEIEGFQGYSAYMDELLKDKFFGKICSTEEAEKMFRPTNHGYKFSELYSDFRDDK